MRLPGISTMHRMVRCALKQSLAQGLPGNLLRSIEPSLLRQAVPSAAGLVR